MLGEDLSTVLALVGVVLAYIMGHIITAPSAWLLQDKVVMKWLKPPSINLFRCSEKEEQGKKGWRERLFGGYLQPLPKEIQDQVWGKASVVGITEAGNALFIHAFGKVKANENAATRLDIFLNLYGFCRNMSLTLFLVAFVVVSEVIMGGAVCELLWALVAVITSVAMFNRYLKFFRQYSYELFITYAALPSQEA